MELFGTIMSRIFHHPAATGIKADQTRPENMNVGGTPFNASDALAAMAKDRGQGPPVEGDLASVLRLVDVEPSTESSQQLAAELDVQDATDHVAVYSALLGRLKESGAK